MTQTSNVQIGGTIAKFPLTEGQANLYVRRTTHFSMQPGDVSFDLEAGDNVMSASRAQRYASYLERVSVAHGIQDETGEWVKVYRL